MRIALVSCSKLKADYPCPARELYWVSDLFNKAVRYIEQTGYDDWYILSAKYGLLHKDTIIEPYDVTLNHMPANERRAWAGEVMQSMKEWTGVQYVDFYAGMKYRQYLIPLLEQEGVICGVPLEGKGLLQQKKFYKEHIR